MTQNEQMRKLTSIIMALVLAVTVILASPAEAQAAVIVKNADGFAIIRATASKPNYTNDDSKIFKHAGNPGSKVTLSTISPLSSIYQGTTIGAGIVDQNGYWVANPGSLTFGTDSCTLKYIRVTAASEKLRVRARLTANSNRDSMTFKYQIQ